MTKWESISTSLTLFIKTHKYYLLTAYTETRNLKIISFFLLLFHDSQVTHPKSRNCLLSFLHPPFLLSLPSLGLSGSRLDNRNCPLASAPTSHPSAVIFLQWKLHDHSPACSLSTVLTWSLGKIPNPWQSTRRAASFHPPLDLVFHNHPGCEDAPFSYHLNCSLYPTLCRKMLFFLSPPDKQSPLCWY